MCLDYIPLGAPVNELNGNENCIQLSHRVG